MTWPGLIRLGRPLIERSFVMENLFEPKTLISTVKGRFRKIWSAITDPKKIKDFFSTCLFVVILLFAVIGMFVTLGYLKEYTDYNRYDAELVSRTTDGDQVLVCKDTIRKTENGLIATTIIIKPGSDTELYYQKMFEVRRHGNSGFMWGEQLDIEIDPQTRDYRVVAERIIDFEEKVLINFTGKEQYWEQTTAKPTAFKSVIDAIMRWHDNHR
jgi:hypothetical protein